MVALGTAGLTRGYGRRTALSGVDLSAPAGRAVVIRGGNGSGKTTLLRCLSGAERPDAGEVFLEGELQRTSSPRYWAQVYGVPDDFAWFPGLTIGDHFTLHDRSADPGAALARFDVADLRDRMAASLSSGQLRRAALATTFVRPWKVLLLDEPEQRLDGGGVVRLANAINGFLCDGRTVILSTHSDTLQSMVDADVVVLGRP